MHFQTSAQQETENTAISAAMRAEQSNTTAREMRDYLRTGDQVILRRVLFRMFMAASCPPDFQVQKACALVQLMATDPTFVPQVSVTRY